MILSRLVPLGRMVMRTTGRRPISTTPARRSDAPWTYREFTPANKMYERWADVAGTLIWWWIFWHLFTDYEHIIGEKTFIYPETWTDKELGVPPDDEEDPE